MGVLGRIGSIFGCLGEFRAVRGASWEYLGPSGRRLGVVLEASWTRLGSVWERRGPSWGVMWASWERFGGILCLISNSKDVTFRHAILDTILQIIFIRFYLRKSIPECRTIIEF